jgi:hypothetical protein
MPSTTTAVVAHGADDVRIERVAVRSPEPGHGLMGR